MVNNQNHNIDDLRNDLRNDIKKLNKKIKKANKRISELEQKNQFYEQIIETNHIFLNTLFVDYELKPRGILKNMHELSQELLDFVVNVCLKHDLNYWLCGGNLIGAIRNQGYVPWDDDMDVGMMRKDFHKFNDIILYEIKSNNLENHVDLKINPITKKNFALAFTQLHCITSNGETLAGIDIFPYDYAKDKNFTLEEFCDFRVEFYTRLSTGDNINNIVDDYYKKFNLDFDDGRYVIPNCTLLRYSEKYQKPLLFWDKERIFPLSTIKFNDKYYNCPRDSKYFLETDYGDFMHIPKILTDLHFNCDSLRNVEDIEEEYSIFINKLKESNENFKF